MWAIYKLNILRKAASGELFTDIDTIAITVAEEYDRAVRLGGGDSIDGFPIVNGNVEALINGIRSALMKGQNSGLNDFNLLDEIGPALTAYWTGAVMGPYPNPLKKPLGYLQVVPAPGTISCFSPEPIGLAKSAAKIAAETIILDKLIDELKKKVITILGIGTINVYETANDIIEKKITDPKIKKHPAILPAILLLKKAKRAKIPSPNMTLNSGIPIKFPKPKIPRAELIEKAKKKILDKAIDKILSTLKEQILENILSPYVELIMSLIELPSNLPKAPSPRPTKSDVKKFVNDSINGITPQLNLSFVQLPNLPTKSELESKIKELVPDVDIIQAQAFGQVRDLIYAIPSQIPNIQFPPPTEFIKPSTVIWCNSFVNYAKNHLLTVGGLVCMICSYPPPAPPAPAYKPWNAYTVLEGPPIPDIPIPTAFPSYGNIKIAEAAEAAKKAGALVENV